MNTKQRPPCPQTHPSDPHLTDRVKRVPPPPPPATQVSLPQPRPPLYLITGLNVLGSIDLSKASTPNLLYQLVFTCNEECK